LAILEFNRHLIVLSEHRELELTCIPRNHIHDVIGVSEDTTVEDRHLGGTTGGRYVFLEERGVRINQREVLELQTDILNGNLAIIGVLSDVMD